MNYFDDQVQTIVRLVDEQTKKTDRKTDTINVYSINGERGFGKTTLLKELVESSLVNKYKVSRIIDPVYLMGKLSTPNFGLIELVMNEIKHALDNKNDFKNDNTVLIAKIEEVINISNELFKGEKDSYIGGLYILSKIEKIQMFKEKIENIIRLSCEVLHVPGHVVIIDDFDLVNNKVINKIVNELHYFFNISQIHFIFAYKREQLVDALIEDVAKEYDISTNIGNSDLKSFVHKAHLKHLKLFPKNLSINLPDMKTFLGSDEKAEEFLSRIVDLFGGSITPHSILENTRLLYPDSPREYHSFLEYMSSDINDKIAKLYHLQNYLYNEITSYKFIYELTNIATEYFESSYEEKNWVIVNGINQLCIDKDMKDDKIPLQLNPRDSLNTTLGDVVEFIRRFNSFNTKVEGATKFFYYMKLLISIDLKIELEKFYSTQKEYNDYTLDNYNKLVGGFILPLDKKWFRTNSDWSYIDFNRGDIKEIDDLEFALGVHSMISNHPITSSLMFNSTYLQESVFGKVFPSREKNAKVDNYFNVSNATLNEIRKNIMSEIKKKNPDWKFLNSNKNSRKYLFSLTNIFTNELVLCNVLDKKEFINFRMTNVFLLDRLYDRVTYRSSDTFLATTAIKLLIKEIESYYGLTDNKFYEELTKFILPDYSKDGTKIKTIVSTNAVNLISYKGEQLTNSDMMLLQKISNKELLKTDMSDNDIKRFEEIAKLNNFYKPKTALFSIARKVINDIDDIRTKSDGSVDD